MAFTIQKRGHGESKWVDVATRESLDEAILLATQTEKHAPADQARDFDVAARVLDGRRVIWK